MNVNHEFIILIKLPEFDGAGSSLRTIYYIIAYQRPGLNFYLAFAVNPGCRISRQPVIRGAVSIMSPRQATPGQPACP
jgi:hypothetical protein